MDYSRAKGRVEEEMAAIHAKKDRLLELHMADALTVAEFKNRNEAFNKQLRALEVQLATICAEEQRQKESGIDPEQIRAALDKELSFTDGINSGLVTTILDKIIVKKESTKEEIHLDIYLRLGDKFEAILPSISNNNLTRVDAQGNSLWRTRGEFLSSDYNHHTKICYTAMLMDGQAVRKEVCYG